MRRAFTLAELLVTITIILILSGISLRAMVVAQEYARADKTRATIAKINHEIMAMYESYDQRRLPVNVATLPGESTTPPRTLLQVARRTLDAKRDLIRMEMPDRWSDVLNGPTAFGTAPYTSWWPNSSSPAFNKPWCNTRSSLASAYKNRHDTAKSRLIAKGQTNAQADATLATNASAELLYLIVTNSNHEAREYFLDSEVSDTDGDQLFEFVDGWNRPIQFLRWAPAFTDSDIQRKVWDATSGTYNSALVNNAVQTEHDPTDTRRLDNLAWKLSPLVYSCGADGDAGIDIGTSYIYDKSPFTSNELGRPISTSHFDNIHNHRASLQ